MMRRVALLVIAAVVILAACGGSEDSAVVGPTTSGSEPALIATAAPAAETAPTSVPASQSDQPQEDLSAVPFPPPQNLTVYEDREPLVLGSPPSIFDLYDDIAPIEDFGVYEGGQGQVLMTEAFVKEGLTYGYVTWTVDGVTQSTSSLASNELATCAADVLAASMDRFDAELVARGVIESDEDAMLGELLEVYIECGGTDELLTSFRDDIRLDRQPLFDIACVEATVTTEEHLRIVSNSSEEFSEEFLDGFVDLVGPCFNWSVIPFALENASLLCLEPRKVDGLRSILANDFPGFTAILESCLTPEELTQIPN